ncbi:MAG: extracellular solute-binding protein [Rhizobiales bacterium]|nr:extracellular solute-binding protein [Hyphomicrobiales bacterium]
MRTKRKLATGAAVGLGTLVLATIASAQSLPDLHGKSFSYAGWGGDTQKYQDEVWLKPFAETTGVKIDQTDTPTVAALKTQQEANNVGIDVMQIDSSIVDAGCGTIFQEAKIDRSQLDPALDKNKCGVPVVKFSYVLAYNAKKFETAPTSVADFFDVEKFPGVRAARGGISNVGLIEGALLADGVEPSKIYPIDLDRAVKKLERIKDSIEIKDSFAILQDGLANGEFDMALIPNGRAFNATKVNPDIKVVFNGAVWNRRPRQPSSPQSGGLPRSLITMSRPPFSTTTRSTPSGRLQVRIVEMERLGRQLPYSCRFDLESARSPARDSRFRWPRHGRPSSRVARRRGRHRRCSGCRRRRTARCRPFPTA